MKMKIRLYDGIAGTVLTAAALLSYYIDPL